MYVGPTIFEAGLEVICMYALNLTHMPTGYEVGPNVNLFL